MKGQENGFRKSNQYTAVYPFKALVSEKSSARPTRRLVLVDIENYCGKGVLGADDIRMAKSSITKELALASKDLVVIGTSHSMNCLVSGIEWRGPRLVLRKGHDGAELALIEAAQDYMLETFAAVIIVSGDGAFTDIAKTAKACSKPVVVAARRGSLSRSLALAASAVRYVTPAA